MSLILASHLHEYIAFEQRGIPSYITGGLGAPLASRFTKGHKGERLIHHVLEIDASDAGLSVRMHKFPGSPDTTYDQEEPEE